MTSTIKKGDLISLIEEAVATKYIKGGIGLEGRCPMYISTTQPEDFISEIGDLWYQP